MCYSEFSSTCSDTHQYWICELALETAQNPRSTKHRIFNANWARAQFRFACFFKLELYFKRKWINTKGKKLLKSRKLGQRKLSFKKKTRHHFQKQHIFNFIFKLTFISTLDLWLFIVNLIFIDEQIIFIMAKTRLKIW